MKEDTAILLGFLAVCFGVPGFLWLFFLWLRLLVQSFEPVAVYLGAG